MRSLAPTAERLPACRRVQVVQVAGWQTADVNVHKKTRRRLANGMELQRRQAKASKKASSTPAVVPGVAPAMAKAGVGGLLIHGRSEWLKKPTYRNSTI